MILSFGTRTIRCKVNRRELDEEDLKWFRGDKVLCRSWLGGDSLSATFKVRDPKLYDGALGLMDRNVVVTVENAEIIDIEPVECVSDTECYFCETLTWPEYLAKATQVVFDSREWARYDDDRRPRGAVEYEIKATLKAKEMETFAQSCRASRVALEKSGYWYEAQVALENGDKEHSLSLKVRYSYNRVSMCQDCAAGRPHFKESELEEFLTKKLQNEHRVYNITGIVLA